MNVQVLKVHTREVLYEKYRTEKLLAKRATRNISDEDRLKLLEGTYIPFPPAISPLTISEGLGL
jgi:septin family protein